MTDNILLTFYGDDFTGTTATAEALVEAGIPTLIFTVTPEPEFIEKHFPAVRAIGIAGNARTMTVSEQESALTTVFTSIKKFHTPVFLYKVCSTFDSSPSIGNIGRAIEIGRRIFSPDIIPIIPAAPRLGRYTVFGNHFAALGSGGTYRLDRHPSISNHPVTPMKEADLLLHLSKQTTLESSLVSVTDLDKGREYVESLIKKSTDAAKLILLFDCLYEHHLLMACEIIQQHADLDKPVFLVGSHELGYGLGRVLQTSSLLLEDEHESGTESDGRKGPLFVLSGSCATVTGEQIQWAAQNMFVNIEIKPQLLLNPEEKYTEEKRIIKASVTALSNGNSVIAHTAISTDDFRINLMKRKADELSLSYEEANDRLGNALGEIALKVIPLSGVRRFVVAGGDTAGRIQKYLNIQALQIAKTLGDSAAPLCYVYSGLESLDGLEMSFKGGQAGSVDFFGIAEAAFIPQFEIVALGSFT